MSGIFQKYYVALENCIKLCPEVTASKLYSKGMIPSNVMSEVNVSSDSPSKKAAVLLAKLCSLLESNPEKLHILIEVLQEEKCFDDVTQAILGKRN